MTKMATIIAVKYIFLNQKANGLGTWYAALGCGPYQVCTNDESGLTLTFLRQGQILIPNAFILEKF